MGILGSCLVVQQLRINSPNAGDPGWIPGRLTTSHMPQLRDHMPLLKIPPVAMKTKDLTCSSKTWLSQTKE